MSKSTFIPQYHDIDTRVRDSFARQKVMTTLGITISQLSPGRIELTMPYSAAFSKQQGFLHGGIVSTALDSACGYAAFSLMPVNAEVLTVEFKIILLAPARGQQYIFRAEVVKPGKTLTFCEGKAYSLKGQAEPRLIAHMTATMMIVLDRPLTTSN